MALNQAVSDGYSLGADARYSLKRARDWQFYADGTGGTLKLTKITVPFGRDKDRQMLSDHVGYVARFRLERSHGQSGAIVQATSDARSKACACAGATA